MLTTVETVEAWLNQSGVTSSKPREAALELCVGSAEEIITSICGRRFDVAEGVLRYRPQSAQTVLYIDDCVSLTSVQAGRVGNLETLASDAWELQRDGLDGPYTLLCRLDGQFWPYGIGAEVAGNGHWGWAAAIDDRPAAARQAATMLAARLYQRHTSPLGTVSIDGDDYPVRQSDPDVWQLIRPYRRLVAV